MKIIKKVQNDSAPFIDNKSFPDYAIQPIAPNTKPTTVTIKMTVNGDIFLYLIKQQHPKVNANGTKHGKIASNTCCKVLASTLPLLVLFGIRWPLFNYGYKQGANVINDVSGAGTIDKLQVGANILGVTVMGGFVPSMIGVKLPVKLGKDLTIGESTVEAKTLQQVLDAIFPYLVPLALTFGCYYLIKVRKMSPLSVILVLFVVAFLLGAIGWMA